MNFKLWHRISAAIVFLFSTIVFITTVAPTLSFWDCGEFIVSAVTLGVPHPPGAPFFQLVGRIMSMLPTASDPGLRVNLQSTFSSSFSVLFTFLVITRLLRMWTGEPDKPLRAVIMLLSGAVGALILSFSDTFWFNASESEVYAIGMFFITIVVWIALEWYARAPRFKDERALLLCAYLMGLSIGIHLLSLLALFFVFFLIFLRDKEWKDVNNLKSIGLFAIASAVGFFLVYPGVVKYIPQFLSGGTVGNLLFVLAIAALLFAALSARLRPQYRLVGLSVLLVIVGYSSYTLVVIRANDHPALNENDPQTLSDLYKYLNREQYGDYPLVKGPNYDDRTKTISSEQKLFPRRWSIEHVKEYGNYSSDLSFFINYQFGHIFLRYFLWNFVGRAGDLQDAPVAFLSDPGDWSESAGYPNRYYAIPFALGLLGLWFHFKKDWKTGAATAALFLVMGLGLVIYFNMYEPQVRERDYFFVGAYYVFAIWAGLGVYALYDMLRGAMEEGKAEKIGVAVAALAFVAAPLNMLRENYQTHDRSLNYVAFDYAYNLLQSCDKDAILFTGGDNDTFPVWNLQDVGGIRRDVRVVNLSLVNTAWYIFQLKNEMPYGAKKVELSMDDETIRGPDGIGPASLAWEQQTISFPFDSAAAAGPLFKDAVPAAIRASQKPNMEFTIKPTFTDPRNGRSGIRGQDEMIIDIVSKNFANRPIYFALTTAASDRVNMDDHLIVEGLAYRLIPYKLASRTDRYYQTVNVDVTRRHLMNQVAQPDSNRSFGFLFRKLNHPKVNLDEQSTRMVMSYRVLFMGLSQVILQDRHDSAEAHRILEKMEQTLPMAIHRMDIALKTDLSWMYYLMNAKKDFIAISDELEKYYLGVLEKDISGRSSQRNPYEVLLNIYQLKEEYRKGIDLMKRYKASFPDDQGVDAQIASWEAMAARRKTGDTTAR